MLLCKTLRLMLRGGFVCFFGVGLMSCDSFCVIKNSSRKSCSNLRVTMYYLSSMAPVSHHVRQSLRCRLLQMRSVGAINIGLFFIFIIIFFFSFFIFDRSSALRCGNMASYCQVWSHKLCSELGAYRLRYHQNAHR